jgi:hypothetical protein
MKNPVGNRSPSHAIIAARFPAFHPRLNRFNPSHFD